MLPTDNAEAVYVALPLPFSVTAAPSAAEPFLNVTEPVVGVPPLDVTVAVNVTDAPEVDGFREETTEVEVGHRQPTLLKRYNS